MMRTHGWRKRLALYIRELRNEPHSFGDNDCWLFVAGAIEQMTGVDHAAPHRGRYKSAKGALGVMKRAGASDMVQFAGLFLTPRQSVTDAQIGDVVAIPTDDAFGFALGILNGEQALFLTPNGVEPRDRSEATHAFEV